MSVPPQVMSEDALIGLNRLVTVARLLSGAVHEVNNALQVISGTVEVLECRPDVPPAFADALARLRSQNTRAAAALAQVLQFTDAEREQRVPINLRETAREVLALRDYAIRRARLSARLDADPATCLVRANRGDLQQALLNVLINAEQALAGTSGSIVLQLTRDGDRVVLRVIDDGPGVTIVPPERAFEPFVTTKSPFAASGLGLWAARGLVEKYGGTLTIESRQPGTALVMTLPAMA